MDTKCPSRRSAVTLYYQEAAHGPVFALLLVAGFLAAATLIALLDRD
jgi:hypothetical protein